MYFILPLPVPVYDTLVELVNERPIFDVKNLWESDFVEPVPYCPADWLATTVSIVTVNPPYAKFWSVGLDCTL